MRRRDGTIKPTRSKVRNAPDSTGDRFMKVELYVRYSSDNQRDASIADQFRVSRAYRLVTDPPQAAEIRLQRRLAGVRIGHHPHLQRHLAPDNRSSAVRLTTSAKAQKQTRAFESVTNDKHDCWLHSSQCACSGAPRLCNAACCGCARP